MEANKVCLQQNESNGKLDPSLLLANQSKTIDLMEEKRTHRVGVDSAATIISVLPGTIHRRRPSEQPIKRTAICLPQKPTFLMESASKQSSEDTAFNQTKMTPSRSPPSQQQTKSKAARDDKRNTIFSITSPSGSASAFLLFGCCSILSSLLLVDARQHDHAVDRQSKATAPKTSRGSPELEEYLSIDRFDSGEQIRAPLLRAPTTLAPLRSVATDNKEDNNNSLLTATSQDTSSYMSPEERKELMLNQENHYEGKDQQQANDQQQQQQQNTNDHQSAGPLLPSSSRRDTYNGPNGAGPTLQPEAAGESDDDPDYDDGEQAQQSPSASQWQRRGPSASW